MTGLFELILSTVVVAITFGIKKIRRISFDFEEKKEKD